MLFNDKVFEVSFAVNENDSEHDNVSSKTVVAETAERAIEIAKNLLTKKEKKTYYVIEVRNKVFCLDN